METSLADELYSEILKPKVELDSLDAEDEEWLEDESSSDKERDLHRIRNQFHASGYRDGIIAGKEASSQQGFNVGFKESVIVGFNWGLVRGVTGALKCLPGELREKMITSEDTGNKFHNLYESVNNLSTTDALKLFGDDLSKRKTEQGDKTGWEEQNSDGSVLDSHYEQLQSLIVESPAIEVPLRDTV